MSWRALRPANLSLAVRTGGWFVSAPATLLVVAAATLLVAAVLAGQSLLLSVLVLGAAFAWFTYRQPIVAAFAAMLFATDNLKFADMMNFPALKLGPGGRLNPADMIVLTLFVLGVMRLRRRGERPMFTLPLLLFGGMVAVSFAFGFLSGSIGIGEGVNGLRALSGFLMYVGLAGLIDTRRKLGQLIGALFLLMVVSVVVQIVEASLGYRLTTAWSVASAYYSQTKTIQVAGLSAPYLWNRARGFLLVGQFLALGGLFWTLRPRFAVLSALALLGFIIALMREWYVAIALGAVLVAVLPRKGGWKGLLGLGVLAAAVLAVFALLEVGGLSAQYPLLQVWAGRLGSVLHFQSDGNYIARVHTWQVQMDMFRAAPLFGYGPGSLARLESSVFNVFFSDTGLPNTLLQYGVFGTAAIGVLIVAVAVKGYKTYRLLGGSPDQGYVAGLLGVWLAVVALYSFWLDFFTAIELAYAVGLVMVLLDRFAALGRSPAVQTRDLR